MAASPRSLGQIVIIGLILGLFSLTISPLITPVLLALLTAMVAYPLFTRIQRVWKFGPCVTALLLTTFISIVFVIPFIFIGIAVVQQALEFIPSIDASILVAKYERAIDYLPFPRTMIEDNLKSVLGQIGTSVTRGITTFLASLPAFALGLVLYVVTLYYGLADGKSMAAFLVESLPFAKREVSTLTFTAEKISRGVILGSLIAGLVQGCIIGFTFAILGIPGALLFGALTAVFSFVPAVGCGPTGLGGAIYLWSNGESTKAFVMLAALGIASTSDNVIKPWILSGETQLHPLLGLLSALGGLAVFGFAGLFLGPLFAALAVAILRFLQEEQQA